MSNEISNFDVIPSTVRNGRKTTITIKPRGSHARFDNALQHVCDIADDAATLPENDTHFTSDITYTLYFVPMEQSNAPLPLSSYDSITLSPQSGCLVFDYTFHGEQEYIIAVMDPKTKSDTPLYEFHLYSLDADLFDKKAYKGDLHIHSCYSDGQEAPEVVAANYRKYGFDFMAITDHYKQFPSKYLLDFYRDVPVDLQIYSGEEVHVPSNYIHVVQINGTFSINEYYQNNKEKCEDAFAKISTTYTIPEGIDPMDFARRIWIAEQIKKSGGFSILVHPHWIYQQTYNMPDAVTRYFLRNNIYDAYEVIGGTTVHESNLQTALYQELRAQGCNIPIVGNSDSHGTDPAVFFKTSYTIVLSSDATFPNISNSIKSLYSVAVEHPKGQEARVYGPYRLVKYVRFLLANYFIKHDELCYEQGRVMRDYCCGDKDATFALNHLTGRVTAFANNFFGNETDPCF